MIRYSHPRPHRVARLLMATLALLRMACRQDMHDQPKLQPLEASDFFGDHQASRLPVPDTVARGHLEADELFFTGKIDGKESEVFPKPVTKAMLERGQERFNIFCSPCHDRLGTGSGMVVRRGYRGVPPSFHGERLLKAPPGHYFDVISRGFGVMFSYASRIPVEDRWAIVAYIRALQLSQHAQLADAPSEQQKRLLAARPHTEAPAHSLDPRRRAEAPNDQPALVTSAKGQP